MALTSQLGLALAQKQANIPTPTPTPTPVAPSTGSSSKPGTTTNQQTGQKFTNATTGPYTLENAVST